ncbi:MAG: sodium-dependent transporter [Elusimicrobiota bacterium]
MENQNQPIIGPKRIKIRDSWGSRLGIILAVAGSAIGLGNFLRFPVQAASNGGGAFMIPYFVALILLGIPLMWIEWTIGRYGGGIEHGTAPGIFHTMWEKNRFIKYFGVIGIFGPLIILIYYTYIESWLLGFAVFSLTPKYAAALNSGLMQNFLAGYQGLEKNQFFSGIGPAYMFFFITFVLNFLVVYFGIKHGIEKICRLFLPIFLLMGVIMAVRVLTLKAPASTVESYTIKDALGFLWNPNFAYLKSAKVWLAAAGQVFFTLSVGIGVILTYASYLKKSDDVVLNGLAAVSTNEFAEVILGSSIVIPAAYMFFGPKQIVSIAQSGTFNLSFVTMPIIFHNIPVGVFFSFLWFLLLFMAGITSSISLLQPAIAFLEDEFDVSREKAVKIIAVICFILCHAPILFISKGVIGELDFWGGTFCLVLFGTVEAFLFVWIFGMDKAWDEIHQGADMKIPGWYKPVIKYVTPTFLLVILAVWFYQEGLPTISMHNIAPENRVYILATRLGLLAIFILLAFLVRHAWRKKTRESL